MYKEDLTLNNPQGLICHKIQPNQPNSLLFNSISTFVFFFFIIQCLKARVIPCPHQLPTRGDNTVSVAQSGTATPVATKQLLPPDRVFKRIIYIYIRQIN